jgi:hypothetical protein
MVSEIECLSIKLLSDLWNVSCSTSKTCVGNYVHLEVEHNKKPKVVFGDSYLSSKVIVVHQHTNVT